MIIEIVLFILTAYLVLLFFRPKENLPPGPWSVPYIGRMPSLTLEECLKQREKFGNIFMITTGIQRFLYICDFKLAKEWFSRAELADRPHWKALDLFEDEKVHNTTYGIIFSNGPRWHHNRRFLLRHLRDLGMGKSKIEGIIMREVESLVEDFKSLTNTPSQLPFSINVAVLNIIWELVASIRFDFSDKRVKTFMDQVNNVQELGMIIGLPDFFPILRYLVPKPLLDYLLKRHEFDKTCSEFEDIINPIIDEHMINLDPNNPCDLMDDYLTEMTLKKSEDYSHFSYGDLKRITFDLFIAGNDTTANMTRWVLLYMAKYTSVQRRIQEMIDSVVPADSLPGLEHRERLSYLDATINEVQRHCSMIPAGVFRFTVSDITFNGYFIPKDTVVMTVAGFSHKDPTYWNNPEEFNPSRFLDANGKYIANCDGFQAFGLGKRQCIGEQFARMELYLIIGALLHTFSFQATEGNEIDITPNYLPNLNFPKKDQDLMIKLRR